MDISAPIHSDHVRENGTVENALGCIETYYRPCLGIGRGGLDDEQYVRVFIDDGATNIETRISFSTLARAGWKRVDNVPGDSPTTIYCQQ